MNFLAFLIAGFSISITALLSDNSDPTDPASLSSDLSLPNSLSLDIPDEGDKASLPLDSPFISSLSQNPQASLPLDPSLSSLSPLNPTVPDKELSPSIDNPDVVSSQATDVPESITFSPNIDSNPSGNNADQPSITNPSPGYTEAQISKDDSNQVCDSNSNTGQKRKKRDEDFCMTLEAYLFLPNPTAHAHQGSKSDEQIRKDDKVWENRYFPNNLDSESSLELSNSMSARGRDACNSMIFGFYKHALCCLGPEWFEEPVAPDLPFGLGTILGLGPPPPILNVHRCIGFLDLRPFCFYGVRYCCKFIGNPFLSETWLMGFHGLNCVHMPPLAAPRLP